jgi:hypothetical protein
VLGVGPGRLIDGTALFGGVERWSAGDRTIELMVESVLLGESETGV